MNQKNSLGLDICFKDLDNPIDLFKEWFDESKKYEQKDPNALALATSDETGTPSVRMVLLKDYDENGFVFFTNFNSNKSNDIKNNPKASMCFHWKSLLRQILIIGTISQVSEQEANEYFRSRSYLSKIGAWASKQSEVLNNREELNESIKEYKNKFPIEDNVPWPSHWSGWKLNPNEIEFWLNGDNRIHQRLKYNKKENGEWKKFLLYP